MAITERLILPVQGGQEQWKVGLKSMLETLKGQKGCIRTRWGPQSENENNLELLIGWESEEAQKKFQNGPDFPPAMEKFKPHMRSGEKPTVYFVKFEPYAPKEIIDAEIVQVITISGGSADEAAIRASLAKYSSVEGCTGVAGGYATSEVDGKKTFVGIMGWSTLEASSKNSSVKVEAAGASIEEHHVNFRYPIKGFRGL